MAQLLEFLPGMHEALGSFSAHHKPGMLPHDTALRKGRMHVGTELRGLPELPGEFQDSLRYMEPCL